MEGILLLKHKVLYKALCFLFAIIGIVSVFMAGSFAWTSDFSKINEFIGIVSDSYEAALQKYEKDIDGKLTTSPIKGAQFYLYKVGNDTQVQVGNTYFTDENGQIFVTNLQQGTYYFEETNPSYPYGFDQIDSEAITKYYFTIDETSSKTEPVEVAAYNQRLATALSITKTVNNANGTALTEEQKNTSFVFTVDFSDGGEYLYKIGSNQYSLKSGQTLSLKHGEIALFERLPVGIWYTVTELQIPFYITSSNHHHGTLLTEDGAEVQYTNTYDPAFTGFGNLAISKQVKNSSGSDITFEQEIKEFAFTVTFSNGGQYLYRINNTGPDHLFNSGETIWLKHGQTAVFQQIPEYVAYTVAESDYSQESYVASSQYYEGSIIRNYTTLLPFTNVYDEQPEDQTGTLAITKQVDGSNIDPDREFEFRVTFEGNDSVTVPASLTYIKNQEEHPFTNGDTIRLKHGEMIQFQNLPVNLIYTVSELEGRGYTAAISKAAGYISTGISTDISADDCITVGFVNIKSDFPDTALTVSKVLEDTQANPDTQFEFQLYVNKRLREVFVLKPGETSQTFYLPYGSFYEIIETPSENYGLVSIQDSYGTAKGQTVHVIATNTFTGTKTIEIPGKKIWKTGNAGSLKLPESINVYLKIQDTVVDTATVKPDANKDWLFSFTVPQYDKDGNEIQYTLEEVPVKGFMTSVSGYTITNTYISPTPPNPPGPSILPVVMDSVRVKKLITGQIPEQDSVFRFQLTAKDNAPMPAGAANSIKVITISGAGENEFGKITYDKEGTYTYTVAEIGGEVSGYTYDQTVYTLTIVVKEENNALKVKSKTLAISGSTTNREAAEFTNSYKKGTTKITISGIKTWIHGNNLPSNYPKSITIYVKNGNSIVVEKRITVNEHWYWSFTLDKYDSGGNEIHYTIDEAPVENYQKKVEGYNLINTYDNSSLTNIDNSNTPSGFGINKTSEDGSKTGNAPKTVDDNKIWFWLTLSACSLTVFTTLAALGLKKWYVSKYRNRK